MTEEPVEGAGENPAAQPPPSGADAPTTGDRGVDAIVGDLVGALEDPDRDDVEAVAEAHRRLQARLAGPSAPPPGQARPGPG